MVLQGISLDENVKIIIKKNKNKKNDSTMCRLGLVQAHN